MEGPPLGPGGEDITWPDQVAPRGQKASSTRKIKRQASNLLFDASLHVAQHECPPLAIPDGRSPPLQRKPRLGAPHHLGATPCRIPRAGADVHQGQHPLPRAQHGPPPTQYHPTDTMPWERRTWVDRVTSLSNFRGVGGGSCAVQGSLSLLETQGYLPCPLLCRDLPGPLSPFAKAVHLPAKALVAAADEEQRVQGPAPLRVASWSWLGCTGRWGISGGCTSAAGCLGVPADPPGQ